MTNVQVTGKKISKSLGNIVLVSDLINKGFNPLSLRYLALTSHYRRGLNFTWESLNAARNALNSLYQRMPELKKASASPKKKQHKGLIGIYQNKFIELITNDLNLPKALALAWKILKDEKLADNEKYKLLIEFDKVFGLNLAEAETPKLIIPKGIEKLVQLREKYRQEQKWREADEAREKLKKLGWQTEDTPRGPRVKKK